MLNQFDFLHVSTMRVAIIGSLILFPFSINNFINDRLAVGFGSLVIIVLLAMNAWGISRGRYSQNLIVYLLVPCILFFMVITFKQQGIVGALWCYPSAVAFYAIMPERKAWMSNVLLLAVVAPCSWYFLEYSLAIRVVATLLTVSVLTAIFIHIIYGQQEKLKSLIVTDPLTGLLNRSLLQSALEDVTAGNERTGVPSTLLEIDVDHFKEINDSYGHDVGDRVLEALGELLGSKFRETDKVFRIGGEEFLVLLYNTDEPRGMDVAEELRSSIEGQRFIPQSRVTVSVGVAELVTGENWDRWLKRADERLYQAKAEGRNRVVGVGD